MYRLNGSGTLWWPDLGLSLTLSVVMYRAHRAEMVCLEPSLTLSVVMYRAHRAEMVCLEASL